MTEGFAPYGHALASLGGWALLLVALLILSAAGKPLARTESGHPVRNYADPVYRRSRAFMNAIEITGPFLAATVACILIGTSPFVVNLLASVFLLSRIGMAIVHIGTEIEWLRSLFWFIGLVCTIVLAVMAVFGAFAL